MTLYLDSCFKQITYNYNYDEATLKMCQRSYQIICNVMQVLADALQ